jgi:hypothetical protein
VNTSTCLAFDVRTLPSLFRVEPRRIALARQRQAALFRRQTPDAWPIAFSAPLNPAQKAIPAPNYKQAFDDADLMTCAQVRAACGIANAHSDAVPSIRANMGTGTLLACLGLEQEVFPDKMPWLQRHLTKEQISHLTPDDIRICGTFERGLDYMRRFQAIMGDALPVYCMDTQGPLDLAHLLMGDDLFYALYDDPPFVHHLMSLCLELGIKAHTWMKAVSGEPHDSQHHGNELYAENMGVRICEDTTAILGPDCIRDFALPYTQRLARHFGGAWVHYCGRNDHVTEAVCQIPEIRGINFGFVPGHEHDHIFEEDMERCRKYNKVYIGGWPKRPGETGKNYLRRMHRWAVQGCLFPHGNAALGGEDGLATVPEALDFWYNLRG